MLRPRTDASTDHPTGVANGRAGSVLVNKELGEPVRHLSLRNDMFGGLGALADLVPPLRVHERCVEIVVGKDRG